MFKKSLAAVAVLGAFAANSMAADVTVYGKLDAGFKYENTTVNNWESRDDVTEALTLDSGVQDASRFGIKGSEDLGNGYKVSFVLENGFKGDDGNMSTANKLFDRQAHLTLATPYGNFTAGRTGAFSQASGPYDVVFSRADAFDGGHKDVLGFIQAPKLDNLLAYQTPKFAGFQATAMYSFKNASGETIGFKKVKGDKVDLSSHEGHADANHYAAFGLTYDIGALQTAVSYEQIIRSDKYGLSKANKMHYNGAQDDAKIVTFGGNYDFDMFKLFAMGQYFDGVNAEDVDDTGLSIKQAADGYVAEAGVNGYGLHVGATFDALGGAWETAVYYVDAEADMNTFDVDGQYFGAAARYAYALSSRTFVKASVGYDQVKWDDCKEINAGHDFEKNRYFSRVSLVHNF